MAKASGLLGFLVDNDPVAVVEVDLAGRLKGHTIKVRPMTSQEWNDWQKAATRKVRKKKEVETIFDESWFNLQVVTSCVVEPTFNDAEVLKQAGCATPAEFVSKMFLPGEIVHIADFIIGLSGFGSDSELEEKAKNS